MSVEIKLPSLGENVESGDVLSILVSEGDQVEADQGLIELETDKATVEVPSTKSGKVSKIHVSDGDTIEVGQVIVTLEEADGGEEEEAEADEEAETAEKETSEEESTEAPEKEEQEPDEASDGEKSEAEEEPPSDEDESEEQPQEKKRKRPEPAAKKKKDERKGERKELARSAVETGHAPRDLPKTPEGETPGDGRSFTAAGPAVRRLARELGVDLRRVRGSGEGGRIRSDDVRAYVREATQRATTGDMSGGRKPPPGEPSADEYGGVRRERMTRMRQTIARNMTDSYTTIPQLTNFDDADITELERIRQESKADYAEQGIKLTTLPFLIKAAASALRQHPIINASIDTETSEIVYKEYIHIGVAVDTERGLLVPVMRDVDRMNIPQIAHELARLAEMARSGDYTLDDLRGGTFTISNLGAIGGTYSTPIINPPQVAILLPGRARTLPVYTGEALKPRLMMPLSITYDHRVVDGAAAARFLNDVKGYLSAPGRLLLAP